MTKEKKASKQKKSKKPERIHDPEKAYFEGKPLKYGFITVTMFLLQIITLMLAKPVAVVVKQRYIAKNTVINGKRLEFVGKVSGLMVNYLKWYGLCVITLFIYASKLSANMKKWTAKNTVFEGSTREFKSKFVGGGKTKRRVTWKCRAIRIFSFGLAAPYATCIYNTWQAENTYIDGKQLEFSGKASDLIGKYLLWILLTLLTVGIYGIWLNFKMKDFVVSNTFAKRATRDI